VTQPNDFIPALRFRSLTRFYDRVLVTTLKEEKFKRLLVQQANPKPGQRVLDLGCGTGTLTVLAKRSVPAAEMIGLDADTEALEIAKAKAVAAGVEIDWHQDLAWEAPFSEGTFDRIVSSLVFHHLRGRGRSLGPSPTTVQSGDNARTRGARRRTGPRTNRRSGA
jgi:ubiquinone/menaquinone biosynthesis C-methylase UbiE